MDADESPAALIVPYEDGPLLVRGDFVPETPDGERIARPAHRGAVPVRQVGGEAVL
jgi:hypothetical protein